MSRVFNKSREREAEFFHKLSSVITNCDYTSTSDLCEQITQSGHGPVIVVCSGTRVKKHIEECLKPLVDKMSDSYRKTCNILVHSMTHGDYRRRGCSASTIWLDERWLGCDEERGIIEHLLLPIVSYGMRVRVIEYHRISVENASIEQI